MDQLKLTLIASKQLTSHEDQSHLDDNVKKNPAKADLLVPGGVDTLVVVSVWQTIEWWLEVWIDHLIHGCFMTEYAQHREAKLLCHTTVSTLWKNTLLDEYIVFLDEKSAWHDWEHKGRRLLLFTSWTPQAKLLLNLVVMFNLKYFAEKGYTYGGLKLMLYSFIQVMNMRDKVQHNRNFTSNSSSCSIIHEALRKKRDTYQYGPYSLWCLDVLGKEEKDQAKMLVHPDMLAWLLRFRVKHIWRYKQQQRHEVVGGKKQLDQDVLRG
ncbi:unnamed protein product [Cochlearia groenlandica]